MRMRRSAGGLATLLACAAAAAAQTPPAPLTVERIFGTKDFASRLEQVRWLADGTSFAVLEPATDGTTDLYRVDAVTGHRTVLLRGAALVPPGGRAPIRIEDVQFSPDGSRLLLFTNSVRVWRTNTKGTYYIWDVARHRLRPLSRRPGYQMFAKFSPNGRLVGFVRDHDLFVTDLTRGTERRLTSDGSDTIINGTTDWVYEEELGLRDAFRFSPDSRRIAFWRFDQRRVRPYYLLDDAPHYPELIPVRYPLAGTENARVRLGVVGVRGGPVRWIHTGSDSTAYYPQMDFANASDSLWFLRLNREQDRLQLLLANVVTGRSRVVLTDADSAWVEVHAPLWLDRGRQFLFESQRDGYRHLFLYRRDGRLVRKVTSAPWDVLRVYGVDEGTGTVYFTAAADGPLERPLYAIGLDGRNFRRISADSGTHTVSFSPTFGLYVDVSSRAGVPPVQRLYRADGTVVRVLADNHELAARIDSLDLVPPEFLKVPTAPGVELNAYLIKPRHFDPARRHPLLMYVYGGPGSQTVTDAWGGSLYLWHQMLARDGYLVASVDNRGTGARGARFEKITYLKLGTYESADQIAAARFFASRQYVDSQRVGIWGASFGGYLALLSALKGPGVFKAAIACAPVTDWRLYDTIYTERYLRMPQQNAGGYRLASAQTYADQLESSLLLVHGTGDDNVHPQNTLQMIRLLEEANKPFDLRLYPGATHAFAGAATRVNLYTLYTEWLRRHLGGER